jgi:hypothetical protein
MMKEFPKKQLERMLDLTFQEGIAQHCKGTDPDFNQPSSIDDNARALIVLSRMYPYFDDGGAHEIYLNFIKDAKRRDGFFNNYQTFDGKWILDKVPEQDCFGRAMWALAEFSESDYPRRERDEARDLFFYSLTTCEKLTHPKSIAFGMIALSSFLGNGIEEETQYYNKILSVELKNRFKESSCDSWNWFSNKMTYCNARMPHALFLAGDYFCDKAMKKIGSDAMNFLISKSFDDDVFNAIGNSSWYKKGCVKSRFDQQSIEAGAMVEACVCGYDVVGNEEYYHRAEEAFDWFKGRNIAKQCLLSDNGGVYDSITEHGVNINQGAESLLSYLMASTVLEEHSLTP